MAYNSKNVKAHCPLKRRFLCDLIVCFVLQSQINVLVKAFSIQIARNRRNSSKLNVQVDTNVTYLYLDLFALNKNRS